MKDSYPGKEGEVLLLANSSFSRAPAVDRPSVPGKRQNLNREGNADYCVMMGGGWEKGETTVRGRVANCTSEKKSSNRRVKRSVRPKHFLDKAGPRASQSSLRKGTLKGENIFENGMPEQCDRRRLGVQKMEERGVEY